MLIDGVPRARMVGDAGAMLALLPGAASAQAHVARGVEQLAAGRYAAAIAAFRQARAAGDNSPVLRLNLAVACDKSGDRGQARFLMRSVALDLPDWDEPWLRLAESMRAEGRLTEAASAYEQALERAPDRPEALIALGAIRIQLGEPIAAQSLLVRACGVAPEMAEAWDALGLALMMAKDLASAVTAFIEARRREPARLEFAEHLFAAVERSQRLEEGAHDKVLALAELECVEHPANPVAHALRALLLEAGGRRDEAIDALETATILAPESAGLMALHGAVLARALRLREAAPVLRRAHAADPENPSLASNLAAVLMRLHFPAEACALLEEAHRRMPQAEFVLCNAATATASRGRQAEAVALARRAIRLAPGSVLARRTLACVMAYDDASSGTALSQALDDVAAVLPRAAAVPIAIPDPARRLRVGLLSGSFRTHPVGWLTIAGLEALPRDGFDLVGFSAASWGDAMNRRFRAITSSWHDISGLSDAAAAALIRANDIDVLIDLGGYGDTGRMTLCALRPAPMQVKWVGMQFHTSGLPEMDWFITDRWETPPELAGLYSERLLTLPDGYVCYSPPADAPDCVAPPAFANGFVTFGCMNNLAKVTPAVLAVWARILRDLPEARLRLRAQQFCEAETADFVRDAFVAAGVEAERVLIGGPLPHRAFLDEYNRIDIALDPFPYSGGLTTCEALWMGVPTIALPGESFAARHSLSHLSNVGLADWAAGDVQSYHAMALRRAADLPALAALRAGLRARTKASPLCDSARFGRGLARALRHGWAETCRRA